MARVRLEIYDQPIGQPRRADDWMSKCEGDVWRAAVAEVFGHCSIHYRS